MCQCIPYLTSLTKSHALTTTIVVYSRWNTEHAHTPSHTMRTQKTPKQRHTADTAHIVNKLNTAYHVHTWHMVTLRPPAHAFTRHKTITSTHDVPIVFTDHTISMNGIAMCVSGACLSKPSIAGDQGGAGHRSGRDSGHEHWHHWSGHHHATRGSGLWRRQYWGGQLVRHLLRELVRGDDRAWHVAALLAQTRRGRAPTLRDGTRGGSIDGCSRYRGGRDLGRRRAAALARRQDIDVLHLHHDCVSAMLLELPPQVLAHCATGGKPVKTQVPWKRRCRATGRV